MSNHSFQDNSQPGPSPIVEGGVFTEQQALPLLPKLYPFALTETFQAAFGSENAAHALPSSHRVAVWRKHVGNDAQDRENRAVEEHNGRLKAVYGEALRDVEESNRKIQKVNDDACSKYQEDLAAFNAAHAQWAREKKLKQLCIDRKLYDRYADEIWQTLHQERERVDLAIDNVVTVTRWHWARSGPMRASYFYIALSFASLLGGMYIEMVAGPWRLIRSPFREPTWPAVEDRLRYSGVASIQLTEERRALYQIGQVHPMYLGILASSVLSCLAYKARRRANREVRTKLVENLNSYETYSHYEEKRRLARKAGVCRHVLFTLYDANGTVEKKHPDIGDDICHVMMPRRFDAKHDWDNDCEWDYTNESYPLGRFGWDAFEDVSYSQMWAGEYLLHAVPLLGAFLTVFAVGDNDAPIQSIAAELKASVREYREKKHAPGPDDLTEFTGWWERRCVDKKRRRRLAKLPKPKPPTRPVAHALIATPTSPQFKTPEVLKPPASCFDSAVMGDIEYVFRGSQVYGLEQVTTVARSLLFADDVVRPHFDFGGAPFAIRGNAPHMLIVGTSGSGKTTTLLRLLSSLLPLSRSQAARLAERLLKSEERYPQTAHEWGRSQTHQAVVYNAKGEYLSHLEAFGFDSEVDLFNLDPADPNGYAWDVAADIDDRDSIEKFAEQLIPKSTAASQDEQLDFWLGTARKVVEAIIVSFSNAARHAGRNPSWTLRDLVTAASSDDSIKHILRWHDTPVQKVLEFFGLSDAQTSSIMMTLRNCLGEFRLVGNRWHDARNRGRAVSLKKWSLEGGQSVLVLPNTLENISSYGPLNKAVVKALTGLWLKDEYSFYVDAQGKEQKRHRHVFIDEFGQAGHFAELERLMAEGRTFGVNVVLGLHQLSQARKAYGDDGSETIVGLCSYLACLKSNDIRTQKWMSEHIGNCLRSYEKDTFSYSTSEGITATTTVNSTEGQSEGSNQSQNASRSRGTSETAGSSLSHSIAKQQSSTSASRPGDQHTLTTGATESHGLTDNTSHTENESATEGATTGTSHQRNTSISSGESEAVNKATNQGTTHTTELRGEPAVEAHEFARFADPETAGKCEGIYRTPTLPVFKATLRMDQVQPEYEFPEKVRRQRVHRTEEEDELVSRSVEWVLGDLQRLFLDKPHTLPEIPPLLILPTSPALNTPKRSPADEPRQIECRVQFDDDETPLADFDF